MLLATCHAAEKSHQAPNIIWVVADDLGYDDTPIMGTGSEIKTPTISKLASEGVTLRNYYVNAICTPTRTSFMSARYPEHLGLQHGVIVDALRLGLPLTEKLVPQYMLELDYATHMVGKVCVFPTLCPHTPSHTLLLLDSLVASRVLQ
jgi:arylsulfatase A-like enzyme